MATNYQSQKNPLYKKVEKILNSEIDSDTLNALKNVSELVNDNTLMTRRNLRAKIEKQSLAVNEQFARQFNDVYQKFQQLNDYITFIDSSCHMMMEKIDELRYQTSDFVQQANQIQTELGQLDDNEKILNEFLAKFFLTNDELSIITGTSGNDLYKIDENFFKLLNKIRSNYEKAKTLLASNQLITGFEIMDSMSKYEELANEKLYRWTVNILRTVNVDFLEFQHSHLFEALAQLQNKEVLFKHCMDEYTIVRRSAVTHSFIEALTRGRSSNNTQYQAMELYSNDKLRYCRDMLSYLHQTIVFERDMLRTLLKLCNQEELAKKNVIKNVISSLTEGVIRILKIRIENCLATANNNNDQRNNNETTLPSQSQQQIRCTKNFFLIKNIINFYLHTFEQILNDDSTFIHFIKELLVSSDKVCYNNLKFYCSQLSMKIDSVKISVTKISMINFKEQLQHYIQLIDELLDGGASGGVPCSSMSFSEEEQQLETERILSTIFEPCIQSIIILATKLPSIDMNIFNLNCYQWLQRTIEKYKFTNSFVVNLQMKINSTSDIIINEQYRYLINSLSINSLCNAIAQNDFIKSKIPLSSLSGCDPITVVTFLNLFDKFLQNPRQLAMKHLNDIHYPTIREQIWQNSLKAIAITYEQIHNHLIDSQNKYDDIIDRIKYRPEDVRKQLTILSE
ncbi:conserved oligomeric Golgi complex subunit 6 [Dermatophagoides farinae]|uniref:Conserved oligomeric Golgi complex subunit 6 n=1 Tax=Dermatophagoides farinae TaxID=6954 RepID=A0A9D4SJ91_DERFA|nr:conserved oligomeric Golgi complex subunit 6-like [Dermatophagoides farinae]KAH7643416.1 conserved oligomeric golgi complex subunit 6-like protein [Dermatophagoides farinae]